MPNMNESSIRFLHRFRRDCGSSFFPTLKAILAGEVNNYDLAKEHGISVRDAVFISNHVPELLEMIPDSCVHLESAEKQSYETFPKLYKLSA